MFLAPLFLRKKEISKGEQKYEDEKAKFNGLKKKLDNTTNKLGNAMEWFFGTGKYEKIEDNRMACGYPTRNFFNLPNDVELFSPPSMREEDCGFACPHAETAKLVMTQDAYKKMLSYAYFANKKGGKEVGMIMVANSDGIVHEIHMPKQVASGGDFSFESIDAMELKKYINNGEKFVGWAHSHSNFGPFLSGTDLDNIETLLEVHPRIFSVVTNAVGETRAWVHLKLPCGQASVREIPISLVVDKDVLNEQIKMEVEEKLTSRHLFPFPGRLIDVVPQRGEM